MAHAASIHGRGFELTIEVDDYEFAELPDDFHDANWVTGRVTARAGNQAEFTARITASMLTIEFAAFRDALRTLVETLDGEAVLEHIEHQFTMTLSFEHGAGRLSGYVAEHAGSALRLDRIVVDRNDLAQALGEFDALLGAFPVREP